MSQTRCWLPHAHTRPSRTGAVAAMPWDTESAHEAALGALHLAQRFPTSLRLLRAVCGYPHTALQVDLAGLRFANPIGLAAGFDKNGVAVEALAAMGFGHIEVGTVTPRPQPGQSRPRLFRLAEDRALINRMSFPSQGMEPVSSRLERMSRGAAVVGVNVGANATSVQQGTALEDYVAALRQLAPLADYVTLNVSSPNTPLLRDLQGPEALAALLDASLAALDRAPRPTPLFVKIAPDLSSQEIDDLLQVVTARKVAGIVATNTTTARSEGLRGRHRNESGGLSGAPLRDRSTAMIRAIHAQTQGHLPIIGVGGVFTWEDALEKLLAGASLVQLYTGLVYRGPLIARSINRGLAAFAEREGIGRLQALVGQGNKRGGRATYD